MRIILRCVIAAIAAVLSLHVVAGEAFRNIGVGRNDASSREQRVALVIGNAAYIGSPLKNPLNDARDIAVKLKGLGFDVVQRLNLGTRQIGGTLREFRSKLKPGAVALVFYAGHGLQIKGENYLPTVDADINSEEDVPNQSLAVRQIMDVLDEAKTGVNLIFLDACRNNPYARSFRSTASGLARVDAPSGTLISFATRPGSVAADGKGRNGLYTEYLLRQMDEADVPIEQVLKHVLSGVKSASEGRQEPWIEGGIEGDFYFKRSGATVSVPAKMESSQDVERALWERIKDSQDVADFEDYQRQYPEGRFATEAAVVVRRLAHPAATPLVDEQNVKPSAGAPAVVTFLRPRESFLSGGTADVKITVLGRDIGTLPAPGGSYFIARFAAGSHVIWAQSKNFSNQKVIDLEAGGNYYIKMEHSWGAINLLLLNEADGREAISSLSDSKIESVKQ